MAQRSAMRDILELAALARPSWTRISASIPAWHPRCEAEQAESKDEEAADEEGTEETHASDDGHPDSRWDDAPDDSADLAEWKEHARKWERRAKEQGRPDRKTALALKRAQKEVENLQKRVAEREDADKSEQEKAIEDAEQRARKDLEGKFETERRKDRLELATTKVASKGLRIGSGDDAKTIRFADSDDALLHLERDIRNGDLDLEDIFDKDGKVRTDQLTEALTDLLERKPHLAASDAGRPDKVKGSADARKGEPASTEPTVEEQFKAIRRPRPQADQNVLVTRQQ